MAWLGPAQRRSQLGTCTLKKQVVLISGVADHCTSNPKVLGDKTSEKRSGPLGPGGQGTPLPLGSLGHKPGTVPDLEMKHKDIVYNNCKDYPAPNLI